MTIVQINVSDYGSTGAIMQTVQNLARCKGYTAVSFAGRRKTTDEEKTRPVGNTIDTYLHALLARFGGNGHGSKRATEKLSKELKAIAPDAVILHNIHGYYLHLETLFATLKDLAERNGTHIFFVLHDCWSFTGGCAHFFAENCRKWECAENDVAEKNHCGNCNVCRKVYPKSYIDTTEKEFFFKKKLYTSLPREKVTVIAPSQWVAEEASKSFLGQYETKVIPNGVNIEIFKPRPIEEKLAVLNKYGVPTDKPIVLGVASVWDERKQPGLFKKLADIAKDCTVLMAGLSKKQKNNLPKNVYGICRTENAAELACLYSAASVLLDPTLEDTFPLVPLEALACGTPVVTSPVCGCPEQVDHLTGIVLSNPTSVNEAYRAVCAVLNEQKKAASLSVKEADKILFTTELCRSRALTLYDNYKMALSYIELAEEAL